MLAYRYAVDNKLEKQKFKVADKNRSFCDGCGRQLRWYENIPVISWLWLRGRSGCCQKRLPVLYPIVELSIATLWVGYFWLIDSSMTLRMIVALCLIAVMVFSCVVDLRYMILPDLATLVLIVGGIFLSGWSGWVAAVGAVIFLGLIYGLSRGKAMGFGDVKLAVFMGFLLGFPKIVVAFYVAFIVGAVVGVFLIWTKKVSRHSPVPFGPFLFLGTLVAWWYGDKIWYIVFSR